ncbi:hypothetical protein D3C87_2042780 [compost metagenome]
MLSWRDRACCTICASTTCGDAGGGAVAAGAAVAGAGCAAGALGGGACCPTVLEDTICATGGKAVAADPVTLETWGGAEAGAATA